MTVIRRLLWWLHRWTWTILRPVPELVVYRTMWAAS